MVNDSDFVLMDLQWILVGWVSIAGGVLSTVDCNSLEWDFSLEAFESSEPVPMGLVFAWRRQRKYQLTEVVRTVN